MFTEVSFSDFYDGFESRRENFTYEGLQVLFDYLEEYEESTGEKIEFDPIAICCDYAENTIEEFNRNYGTELETLSEISDYIDDRSIVAGLTDSAIVYLAFWFFPRRLYDRRIFEL